MSNSTNIIIMNNIINSYISGGRSTTVISNNIFLNCSAFSDCQSSTISNNIFYYGSIGSTSYCSFSNNMAFGISSNIVTGTNTGSGNIMADPKFVYIYSISNHDYNDQNNYHLQTTSPALNAGTDGTDLGIFGGQYPWPDTYIPNYVQCVQTTIPQVTELNIQNSSVPANGNLNFSVKAVKAAK
jgi:hypothetical protein